MHLRHSALLFLITAAGLFGIITEDVVNSKRMTEIDLQVAAYLHARATPLLTTLMTFISYFGSLSVTGGMAFVIGIILWRQRRSDRLLALVVIVFGGMVLNGLVKYIVHRPRPFFDNPLLTLTSYSFPSGHAMAATVLYGLLVAFAVQTSKNWRHRVIAVSIGVSLVTLVCFSRIYLGVHYLTDVLGGVTEGVAWLALCLIKVNIQEPYAGNSIREGA